MIFERALVITNYARADELKKPNTVMAAVLCNSTRWGGTGGSYEVKSLANNFQQIVVHEFGHSFGGLADEYYYPDDGPFRRGIEAAIDLLLVLYILSFDNLKSKEKVEAVKGIKNILDISFKDLIF